MNNGEIDKLIIKAKARDPDAFTELMQFYMQDMYRVALSILMSDEDCADAIQDTILSCWEKIETLKYRKYFKTWMIRILINKCYDIRKQNKDFRNLEEWEEPIVYDEYNVELKEALYSLGEKYGLVMTMFYCEGYCINEIAKLLKMPKSTVQTRLQRGRAKLAKYYDLDRKETI